MMARGHREVRRGSLVRKVMIGCACLVVVVMMVERGMMAEGGGSGEQREVITDPNVPDPLNPGALHPIDSTLTTPTTTNTPSPLTFTLDSDEGSANKFTPSEGDSSQEGDVENTSPNNASDTSPNDTNTNSTTTPTQTDTPDNSPTLAQPTLPSFSDISSSSQEQSQPSISPELNTQVPSAGPTDDNLFGGSEQDEHSHDDDDDNDEDLFQEAKNASTQASSAINEYPSDEVTSPPITSPTADPSMDPATAEKLKRKAKENAEKEMLERKVRREYADEMLGIPSNITLFRNESSSLLLLPKPLLFLHIPKTAGSTLAQVFKTNSPTRKYYHFWHHPRLSDLPIVPDKEVLFGHFRYGLHFYLPNQQGTYATMLREPVERVISYYHFHLQDPQDPAHEFAKTHTFEEWLDLSQAAQNEMTKCLSGIRSEFYPSEESFEMAKHHLRNMGYVGLTERFDESLKLMKYYFGFTKLDYGKTKVGVKKPHDIEPRLLEKIKEKNKMDIELYEIAKGIFEEEMEALSKYLLLQEMNS